MKTFLHPDSTFAEARCAGEDTELFFREQDIDLAKVICSTCPVRDTCADRALKRGESYGVFGGLSANDRRRLLRAERERALGQPGELPPRLQALRDTHPALFGPPVGA